MSEGKPKWKNRRRVIFSTLVFCALCISYIMLQGNDTRVNETIVLGCFALASSVIGYFVAGATYRDVSMEKIKAQGPRAAPVPVKAPVTNHTQKSNARTGEEPQFMPVMASDGKGPEDV